MVSGGGTGWVSTLAGAHLVSRPSRDTRPEISLRRAVHRRGLRFRLHRRVVPGTSVDFVLPRHRLAVYVDGCFWHGCPWHGPSEFRGPNAALWRSKMAENRSRDERNNVALGIAGWRVLRVWECEIRADPEACADRIETLLEAPWELPKRASV